MGEKELLIVLIVLGAITLLGANLQGCSETVQLSVSENQDPGTEVGNISSTFQPPYTSFFLMGDWLRSRFDINYNNGLIRTKVKLDRESNETYLLHVMKGNNLVCINVTVLDVNEFPPRFTSNTKHIPIAENAPQHKISLGSAVDLDSGLNTVAGYRLVSGNVDSAFYITGRYSNSQTLLLDLGINGTLDYETTRHYTLIVEVFDGGSPPLSSTMQVEIDIIDANDNQPIFNYSKYSANIAENTTVGTSVLRVQATDLDDGDNDKIRYSIDRLTDPDEHFEIESISGILRVNKPLDYELKNKYILYIIAKDGENRTTPSRAVAEIDISNIKELPANIELKFLTTEEKPRVAENVTVGYYVARISVSDPDAPDVFNSDINVRLSGGDGNFGLETHDSVIYLVLVQKKLDREIREAYNLTIIASYSGSPPLAASKSFTLFIDDVNDNPPKFSQSSYEAVIQEKSDTGSSVLQVNATDRDIGENARITYHIRDNPNTHSDWFYVDADSGLITTNGPVDCEVDAQPWFVLVATDHGNPPLSSSVTVSVSVRDVNDKEPTFDQSLYYASVPEDRSVGSCILQVNATDPDCGVNGHIRYFIAEGVQPKVDVFSIGVDSGRICIAKQLDFELQEVYDFPIIARDTGNFATTAYAQITLTDINDNRPIFYPRNYSKNIREDTPRNEEIITVQASDLDSGDYGKVTYSITSGNDEGKFQIDSDQGSISLASALPSGERLYTLRIDAVDGGGLHSTESAEVHLSVTGPNYSPPQFERPMYRFKVSEEVAADTPVGNVRAVYGGSSANIHYSIVSGDKHSFFRINTETGWIHTAKELDHDEYPSILLNIMADVGTTPIFGTTQANITIEDINDNPPVFSSNYVSTSVSEDITHLTAIYSVHATDKDSRANGNGEVRYELTENFNSLFQIDSTSGEIRLKPDAKLDYETRKQYELNIIAADQGQSIQKSSSMTLIINVQDSNDNVPTFEEETFATSISEASAISSRITKIKAFDLDTGENGRITFSLVESEFSDHFGIFPSDGELYLKKSLDREVKSQYVVQVKARDHGLPSLSATAMVTIHVLDDNDNYPVIAEPSYQFLIEENLAPDTFVGHIEATDEDEGNNALLQYSLDPAQDDFFITPSGHILTRKSLDREQKNSSSFDVHIQDSGTPPKRSIVPVHLIVTDVNDHSPAIINSQFSETVDENQPKGIRVVQIVAMDPDAGENGTISFSLLPDDADDDESALDFFAIHPKSGWITTREVLDYELKSRYSFKVVAYDGGHPSRSVQQRFEILVNDENDGRPVFPQNVSMTFYVVENIPTGSTVGRVQAYDDDAGENGRISYYFVGGNHFGLFTVDTETGYIYTIREIDYEESSSHTIGIKAIDNSVFNPKSSVINIEIVVIDVNDNAPVFDIDPVFLKIHENVAVGTTIYTFTATDADSDVNGTVRYEIQNSSSDNLEINPSTGKLYISRVVDYEEVKDISLIIRAYDQAPTRASQLFTTLTVMILIMDENDNAPVFQSYPPFQVLEDEPVGYRISSIIAVDVDGNVNKSGNNVVSYSITDGNVHEAFSINENTGLLTIASELDRETTDRYSLHIRARDHGQPVRTSETVIEIEVLDINDNSPVFRESTYQASVKEHSVMGTIVTKISATDRDQGINADLKYTIPSGIADNFFAVDPVTGLITTTTNEIDREIKSSYFITAYVQDSGYPVLYDTATVIINVTDINDNPPVFKESEISIVIPENTVQNAIHTFVAHDADVGDNSHVKYKITDGNTDGKFSINSDTGVLSSGILDREVHHEYELQITASDGSRSSSCTLWVQVKDQNDNDPEFEQTVYEKSLDEDVSPGSLVVKVLATDPDEGDNGAVTYSLYNDTDAGQFDIDPQTGIITTKGTFDREKKSSYSFDVQASDGGKYDQRSERAHVRVTIGDINDNTPVFQEVPYRVNLTVGVSSGAHVQTVIADDKDTGQNGQVTYRLSSASDKKALELFRMEENTGRITTKRSLGQDTVGYHNLKVVASDGGDISLSTTGVVEVMISRAGSGDGDQQLRFRNQNYSTSLEEHSPVNTRVITLELENSPTDVTFSFASGNEAEGFYINNNGLITVRDPDPIDYEVNHHMRLLVVATSNGDSAYTTLWVNLLDINDNAPKFTQDRYVTKVYEEQPKFTYVTQVMATDADSPGPNSDIRYNIIQGNIDEAFTIDPPYSGLIKTNLIVDYEIRDVYRLIIEAVDDGGFHAMSSTCTVKISVIDTNDNPPKFPTTQPVNASEGTEVGTALALVTANDVDISPPVMYDFSIDGNPDGMFSIDRFSGMVRLAKSLDHEQRSHYTIGLQATDGEHVDFTTLTINVLDENDNAPQFSQQSYQVSLEEGTSQNMKVIQVNATDADAGINADITYSLTLAPSDDFYIDSKTGIIYTNSTVVYQPNQAITQLVVTAEDGGNPSLSGVVAVHIQIISINKYAPVFQQTSYTTSISEDTQRGMVIEHVSATDKDSPGRNQEIDYKIIEGNINNKFSIDQKLGRIILNSWLDREVVAEYNLNIIATDRGIPPRNSTPVNVQILILDVNDQVPYFESKEYFVQLNESFPSDVGFLNVIAHDNDEGQNAKLYYVITSGNEEGLFIAHGVTGEMFITPNKTLDYEHHTSHKLVVKATDCEGCQHGPRLSNITTVNVQVTDVNEFAPEFPVDFYLEGVEENTKSTSPAFEAHANDKDGGVFGRVTYSLSGTDKFSIHYESGLVFPQEIFDYETAVQRQFRFNITATDEGGLKTSIPVILNVVDVDEYFPVFEETEYSFQILGSAKNGTIVGAVQATDSDGGDAGKVVYQMKPKHSYFDVNASSGEIRVIYDLNKEYVPSGRLKRDLSLLKDSHRSKRAVEMLTVEAGSGLEGSRHTAVSIQIDIDRTCPNCQVQPVQRPTPDGPAETLSVAIIIIIVVSIVAIILVIIIILILLRIRYRAKDSSPSEAPMYDADDFDNLTPSGNNGPPLYNDVVRFTGGHSASVTHSHDMSGHSNNSASSGRGSAEDEEDEELAMINSSSPYLNNSNGFRKAMPDSGIQDDDNNSEPSVQNHQDYLARLGIDTAKIDSKAKSGLTRSVESMHQFSDAGGGEGDGLEIDIMDYSKLGSGPIDNEVSMLDKSNDLGFHEPEPHMVGSLSNVINSEEEYSGSYNWDYLLDWGPQYQPLAHVFAEIARLKDDTVQPKKTPVQIIPHLRNNNLNAQVRTVPPPMITDAPPKAIVQPSSRSNRSSHSSGSNANSARTSTINTSLPSMPRSPISHESSFTSPALTPSFTPSLSPLATRSPSISPVSNGRGVVSQHSSGPSTPRSRPVVNNRYTFSSSEQELQI